MGDTASYLWTAISKWIPEDRSFTYGRYLLRPLAYKTHSLTPAVLFQVFISGIAAWIVSLCLIRRFHVRFRIAAAVGVLCCIEPLQLVSERFILTEAASTFLFSIYIAIALWYLKSGKLLHLAVLQLLCVPLISIRLSFLPVVLASSIVLPLLGPPAKAMWRKLRTRNITTNLAITVGVHLLLAVLLSQAGLRQYRYWNGNLTHHPPAYIYTDGLFLLCFWAPLIEPADLSRADLRAPVFDGIRFDTHDRFQRGVHCFSPMGLTPRLVSAAAASGNSDPVYANDLAKQTALTALMRNPGALLQLSIQTFGDFFNTPYLQLDLELDEGKRNPASTEFHQQLRTYFNTDYTEPQPDSFTIRWHYAAVNWYRFILLVPPLFTVLAFFAARQYAAEWIYLGILSWMFSFQAVVVTAQPAPRYLTAEAWFTFLLLGAVIPNLRRRTSDYQVAIDSAARSEIAT